MYVRVREHLLERAADVDVHPVLFSLAMDKRMNE